LKTGTIRKLFHDIVLKIKAIYPEHEALSIANRLFEHYLDLTPSQRILSGHKFPDAEKTNHVNEAIQKLLRHEPLQYVLRKAYFMDMEFEVNPSVLIPRQETEELAGMIIEEIKVRTLTQKVKILDIGTGSGCIAIALKHYVPHSEVFALDVSAPTLVTARANAAKYQAEINFLELDILDSNCWKQLPEFDIIVSNPPYVTESDKKWMQPNVLQYEPAIALFVTDADPLVFYRTIAAFAKANLVKNGSLWFEINEQFGSLTKKMLINEGFTESNIFSDIHEKERFLHTTM